MIPEYVTAEYIKTLLAAIALAAVVLVCSFWVLLHMTEDWTVNNDKEDIYE